MCCLAGLKRVSRPHCVMVHRLRRAQAARRRSAGSHWQARARARSLDVMLFSRHKTELVGQDRALRGRDDYAFSIPATHYVNGHPIRPPFTGGPDGLETAIFGLGCFWGAEEVFWQLPGVWTTAVGYAGGYTPHPSYEEVCSGLTGHTEAV